MNDLELHTALRHSIAKLMIECPEIAKLRLRSLPSRVPVEVKPLLYGAIYRVEMVGDQSLIYPAVIVSHFIKSPLREVSNLHLLEKLTYTTYCFTGIAHVMAKDRFGSAIAGYSPITNRYTLWSN